MNNEHKLVQDLFPSYIDGLASDETNKFIEEHISSCEKCNKILEKMKTEIVEENHTDLNDKKVKFAKKVNRRLRVFELIIIIILLIVLGFVINLNRKVIIVRKLRDLGNSYKTSSNYMVYDKNGHYYLYKDGNSLESYNGYTNCIDNNMLPATQKTKIYRLKDGRVYSFLYDSDGNLVSVKDGELNRNQILSDGYRKLETYSDYTTMSTSFSNILKVALTHKIDKINFNGIECYRFTAENGQELYFEAYTGLKVKDYNSNIYYYKFDIVSDEMLEIPEISEELKNFSKSEN